ncbi:glycosyltransferase [Nitrosomonas sp. JL21]|nr:glycosyltransferase [Nitrosomonas sp. JL21]
MPPEQPPRNPVKPARLLFVGGLNWYPNRDAIHYFLDEVWPLIKGRAQEISVDIIGKFPSKKIRQYADSDKRIKVHGFVDDISVFYESASIYICPIRDGGGTKLKVLDALAHRLPLVADRIACEGLDIIDGFHALLSRDSQDMAEKILYLLQNSHTAQQLQENGYGLVVGKYDFSLIGKKLSDLYISMAKSTKGLLKN